MSQKSPQPKIRKKPVSPNTFDVAWGIVKADVCGCAYCETPVAEGEDVCSRCEIDSLENTQCRCPQCNEPMCDECGVERAKTVLPGEGAAMLSCPGCMEKILSYPVEARDWTSEGQTCRECLTPDQSSQ